MLVCVYMRERERERERERDGDPYNIGFQSQSHTSTLTCCVFPCGLLERGFCFWQESVSILFFSKCSNMASPLIPLMMMIHLSFFS